MKIKGLLKGRWLGVHLLLGAAVPYFIYSLGFMTNFYRMFYDGDGAMLEFLTELQLLNRFIFENALITLILAVAAFGLEIHSLKTGVINSFFLIGFIVYETDCLMNFMGAIPYYAGEYAALDFSILDNYNSSPFMFYLCYAFSLGILILLLATGLAYLRRLTGQLRKNREVKLHGQR